MNNAASLAGEGFLLQRKSPWILHLLAGGTAIPGCPLVLSLLVAGRVTLAATLSFVYNEVGSVKANFSAHFF